MTISYRKMVTIRKTMLDYVDHAFRSSPLGVAWSVFRKRKKIKKRYGYLVAHIEREGFAVIADHLSRDDCAETVRLLKSTINRYSKFVHQAEDRRIFGVEQILPAAKRLSESPDFIEIGHLVNREETYCAFTLGSWLQSGDRGSSGGGWHRDAFLSQYKAMVYLTDVNESNGPLEIIPGSHKLSAVIRGIMSADLGYIQHRFRDEEVNRIEAALNTTRVSLTGKSGTLILFDSSAVHRGRPIEEGERLTLTNYYFPRSRLRRDLLMHFAPVFTGTDVVQS